ncbi:LON peptidase N-terminal domain and RING finger protein 1-like isoform X2 [Heterodontus francisci]|uniref:LON peptidase N-terminal domain and RING finger protein 1-like isoform X2 n=1 Tax=Heterodontus francisci TaxID=7792 RepID=UPI00355B15C0
MSADPDGMTDGGAEAAGNKPRDSPGLPLMGRHRLSPQPAAALEQCWLVGSCGALQPEQLGSLVQCLLHRINRRGGGQPGEGPGTRLPEADSPLRGGGLLDCGGCRELLSEPVTLRCGHTWCRRCLRRSPRCPGCGEAAAGTQSLRSNVVLSHLLPKWFPAEARRIRNKVKLEELLAECRFPEALTLLEQLELKPSDALQSYRADSYAGLQLFREAIEDMEAGCSRRPAWPEMSNVPKTAEGELACLSRTQSIQLLPRVENLVGLKRVSSAPLLSRQEKAVLMKRKLSFSDQEIKETGNGKKKHQKQDTEQLFHSSSSEKTITKDLVDASDFECSLCMRLFLEPITTLCGHTFCKGCLERSLDHSPLCPLCKDSLKEYLENRKYAVTYLLEEVIARYLSEELRERQRVHNEETAELSNLTRNVPIFVCTMAYPTVPCPLHVFEPRYRLMIRRCIETGTKRFGMCISDPHNGFTDFGCMLHIRNIHFLPDGRSIVDTVGGNCFKVLERGQKDGYYIANIEYLKDVKVAGEELVKLVDLHDEVYAQACKWFQNLKSRFHSQILQHFGPMPERDTNIQGPPNGPAWCWWLLAVLPVDPKYQLSVLSMTSLKNRLIKIQKILTYFSSARDQSK